MRPVLCLRQLSEQHVALSGMIKLRLLACGIFIDQSSKAVSSSYYLTHNPKGLTLTALPYTLTVPCSAYAFLLRCKARAVDGLVRRRALTDIRPTVLLFAISGRSVRNARDLAIHSSQQGPPTKQASNEWIGEDTVCRRPSGLSSESMTS
jgi:hypothetical protein